MTRRIVYFFYNFFNKFVEKYEEADRVDALSRRDKLNGKKEQDFKLWSK